MNPANHVDQTPCLQTMGKTTRAAWLSECLSLKKQQIKLEAWISQFVDTLEDQDIVLMLHNLKHDRIRKPKSWSLNRFSPGHLSSDQIKHTKKAVVQTQRETSTSGKWKFLKLMIFGGVCLVAWFVLILATSR